MTKSSAYRITIGFSVFRPFCWHPFSIAFSKPWRATFMSTGEMTPPYAKQVTMQRDVRKPVIFSHFQFEFLCIVSDDGFEMVLKYLPEDNANDPTNAERPAV